MTVIAQTQNPHSVLGLDCGVDRAQVRHAYLALALRWHPDKHPPEQREEAECRFKDIQAAYEALLTEIPTPRSVSHPTGAQSNAACAAGDGDSCDETEGDSEPTNDSNSDGDSPAPSSEPQDQPANQAQRVHLPASRRVLFGRGSASVECARDKSEADNSESSRHSCFLELADWARARGAKARLEVRGFYDRGEALAAESKQLAQKRAHATMRFLLNCGLSAEQCCVAPNDGQGAYFQGVEVRALRRLQVNGSFEDSSSMSLRDRGVMSEVIRKSQVKKLAGRYLVVEVGTGPDDQAIILAQSRCSSLRRKLERRGVPSEHITVRPRVGCPDTAVFFVYARTVSWEGAARL